MVVGGTLTMYVGEPPERVEVQRGGLIRVDARTPLQTVNNRTEDLLLYVYGYPPEDEHVRSSIRPSSRQCFFGRIATLPDVGLDSLRVQHSSLSC